MKKTTVIFDWNGTLIDDVDLCLSLLNKMLIKRNLDTLSVERYREIFTFPVIEYYKKAGMDVENESFDDLAVEFMDPYVEQYRTCSLVLHAEEVLAKLKEKGLRCIVLSATKQDYLEEQVSAFNIAHYFNELVGIQDIKAAGKIERAKQWMSTQGIDPKECIMIGDSIHDSEVAAELKIDCLLSTTGHQNRERLKACHRPIVDDLMQIFDYID